MVSKADKNVARLRRHKRVRGKISGTPERPRLDVFRSNMHIYAQLIDDVNGVTLCAASTVEKRVYRQRRKQGSSTRSWQDDCQESSR